MDAGAIIELRVILTGIHADMYRQLLAAIAMVDGQFDQHTLAASMIREILEDEAMDSQDAIIN